MRSGPRSDIRAVIESGADRDWHWQMANLLRDPDVLGSLLPLSSEQTAALRRTARRYPFRVTPYYLSRVRSWSLDDPVLRQVLPDARELESGPGDDPDPFGEERQSPAPGLVQRYPDRVLLLATPACAVHCRHCLRKRAWKTGPPRPAQAGFEAALRFIGQAPNIREVLLSGGDPLLLPDDVLCGLVESLFRIPHVETVRIGSRLPVVLPQRLTPEFCGRLGSLGPVWVATHFNHPAELSDATAQAARNLLRAGIPVVNQSVLLKGINDSVDDLAELCTGLLRQRVKPYYLFHADPVAGAGHFRTGIDCGLRLLQGLRGRVSGLALPAFAVDVPGDGGKIRLEPVTAGALETHPRTPPPARQPPIPRSDTDTR